MKFKITDLSGFSEIGTVVYYKSRVFYPEFASVSSPEDLIEQGKSENYLYSTSMLSDYTDFGISGFTWTRENIEYLPEMLPNLYNYQEATDLIGDPWIEKWVSKAFPNYTNKKIISAEKDHYFGRLGSNSSRITYLIHLPIDTWKVEVYNSRITKNYENNQNFVDYDILQKLVRQGVISKDLISEEPKLSIYFGPGYDTKIQDFVYSEIPDFPLYASRYTLNNKIILPRDEYLRFEKTMTRAEYIESYRGEVLSEKMLYIINSPSGKLEDVNFYSIAYPESNNPHPWRSKEVLRNDHLWGYTPKVVKNPTKNFWIDSRSGSLLGSKQMNPEDVSWWTGANEERDRYSKSGKASEVRINAKTWKKSVLGDVFGENPEISPWWYSPEDLPESRFKYFYLTCGGGKGSMNPGGLVYIKEDSTLRFIANPGDGYKYDRVDNAIEEDVTQKLTQEGELEVSINNLSNYPVGHKFKAVFKEVNYGFDLIFSCQNDYPKKKRDSKYSLSGENDNLQLNDAGIKLYYLDGNGKTVEYDPSNPPTISDSKDLYFRLDMSESNYEISGDIFLKNGTKIGRVNEWYKLRVTKDFLDSVVSGKVYLEGKIESKKYKVMISAVSDVQLSTPRINILEYHNIDPKDRTWKDRSFVVKMALEEDNQVSVEVDGKEKGSWNFENDGNGIGVLTITGIENNYKIIIK